MSSLSGWEEAEHIRFAHGSSAVASLSLEGGNLTILKLNRGRLTEMKNSKHIRGKNSVSKM